MISNKIHYVKSNRFPIFRAFAIPYVGVIIKEKYRGDEALIEHERIHLRQIKRMTLPVFLIRYIFQLILIGYDTMPLELEARQPQGELFNYRKNNWTK